MAQLEASTLITFNPPAVYVEQPLRDALDTFCQWQLTELPIVDRDQHLVGMLHLGKVIDSLDANDALFEAAVGANVSATPDPFQMQRFPRIALQQLLTTGSRILPVVDDGRLIGTLSRCDFLREFAASELRLASAAVLDHSLPAGEGLEANATVDEAFEHMDAEQIDHVAIVQSGCPLAACTRDELEMAIQLARAQEIALRQNRRARAVIQLIRPAPHIQPGQSMAEAAQSMVEHGAMAMLVVNKAKRILGTITESLILTALLRSGA